MITVASLALIPGLRHAFFTRQGGVSRGIYASRNCGYGSNDRAEDVSRNRERCAADLGTDSASLVTVHQTHSDRVHRADAAWSPAQAPKADALVSDRPGIALGILTADCAPVLFADPGAGVIGAAHAGWRGALTGILDNTLVAMELRGAQRAHVVAAIGPRIGRESYEVGPEFVDRFVDEDPRNEGHFTAAPGSDRMRFDIGAYIVGRLQALGVGRIEVVDRDTYADEGNFFSYRRAVKRGEGDYGRCLSAIMLER
ncbi:MAG: peptidoglycan editing factor PgeF [Rhodospirillaceae bacterium]|nr:peptidoglycan editing factor PgeF [Rhodospirillaceae bacterium]